MVRHKHWTHLQLSIVKYPLYQLPIGVDEDTWTVVGTFAPHP